MIELWNACVFFFNDTATTEIYTLSLHDALPISLEALLGPEAKGLSEATISRIKSRWEEERQAWSERDLSSKRYVCF